MSGLPNYLFQKDFQALALEVVFDDAHVLFVPGLHPAAIIQPLGAVALNGIVIQGIRFTQPSFTKERLPEPGSKVSGRIPVLAVVAPRAGSHGIVKHLGPTLVCLQRHGVSRLPQVEGEASPKRKFKAYPIGYFHIDIAEVRTAEGKLYLLVAIDRTSKFAFVELHETVSRRDAADFLRRLIEAVPYKVHTVLTDNGTHFTDPTGNSWSPVEIREMIAERKPFRAHAFEYACATNDVDHRLTKPKHPWPNGQVERMNRTIKDATVKRYFYESDEQLRTHLRDFVDAYNFARRLKTLKGLTPYEFVCKAWTSQPQRFKLNPLQQMPGLNT